MSGADGTAGEERGDEPHDEVADARLAEVLRGSTSGKDLRRAIDSEASPQADDLRARLDALDFVQQVVGGTEDMPKRLGEYEIKGLLGRGGMGTVYLGWQAELEREVALKVLSPAYSGDATMRKRFRAEARATAAMHHRHIVPIYDYGESQGMLFFAMERVVGMSLDKHIAAARRMSKPPMAPLDAAQRFAGVADALGLAHRRRLLHRDVKPGNILVGGDGTLALTDFGLAKALDQASARLTSKGGGFLGTLHYASPEQALGRELTPASDLYSLGVTMFEAITGELPLHGKTTEALLQSILHGTPKRLRECVPQPPRDLELVLEKLLSREPADRYQDGEALARDLQRIADGEPVHIRRLPWHVRIYRRARKNPVLAGAIAATGLLLLVTLVLASVLRRETGRSMVLRHERNLIAIADDIASESGAPWGPAPLFAALTGHAPLPTPPSDAVLAALERAARELPGDIQVPAMRAAYVEDPLPDASALLAGGRGFAAVLRYDEAIRDALAARTGGELSIELRLYRLYLGRGVANLTAAVGRINDARTDLALAAFLRPGSTFPRTLIDLLDVAQSGDVSLALQRLLRDLQPAAAPRRRVVGAMLVAMSGLWPLPQANLVDFGHGHPVRRQLFDAGLALHGPLPDSGLEPGAPTGLSAHFAGLAAAVLQHRSDPVQMRLLAEQADAEIARSTHPEAALYGWRSVLQLLREPLQRGSLLDADGRSLSPALQLAVWDELLRLQPPREMMALWLQRFEQLRQREPNLPGMARVAAQVHALAGTPQAEAMVGEWIAEAGGDPQALACRLRLRLRRGQLDLALDDGMALVQASVARDLALRSVVALCEEVMPALEAAQRDGVASLLQSFATLDGGAR